MSNAKKLKPKPKARDEITSWHGSPSTAMLGFAWLLACATATLSAWWLPSTRLEGSALPWAIGGALIGLGLGALIPLHIAKGARLTLDTDGMLTYYLYGKANLRFPIQKVIDWGTVNEGLLKGPACKIAIGDITFLHRKGLSPRRLEEQQQACGWPLIFEFIDPDCARDLSFAQQDFL